MLAVLSSIDVQKSTQTKTADRQTGTSTEGETERRQSCPLEAEVEALSNQLSSYMAGLHL